MDGLIREDWFAKTKAVMSPCLVSGSRQVMLFLSAIRSIPLGALAADQL
jgi:hypothetical protein